MFVFQKKVPRRDEVRVKQACEGPGWKSGEGSGDTERRRVSESSRDYNFGMMGQKKNMEPIRSSVSEGAQSMGQG